MRRLVLILVLIYSSYLTAQRMPVNEAYAVGAVRVIVTAENTYASSYPNYGYTCDIARLGGSTGTPNAFHADLIGVELASGIKDGYRFTLRNCVRKGKTIFSYSIVAYPLEPGRSGVHIFCSDQTGVIRIQNGGRAETCGPNSRPLQ